MNNSVKNKKNRFVPLVKMLLGCALVFATVLLFMPEMGVYRTFPFLTVSAMAAFCFGISAKLCMIIGFLMTLCMYLALGHDVLYAAIFSVVAAVLSGLGVYIVRFARIASKTQKSNVRTKSIVLAVFSALLALIVCFVSCGNPISFVNNERENVSYIKENYNDKVQIKYTTYAPFDGEYRTYVKFYKDGAVYGVDSDCYVSSESDGIREVFSKDVIDSASMSLSRLTASPDGGFYVVKSCLAYNENEVHFNANRVDDYLERISYVLSFDGILSKNDKDKFAEQCNEALEKITNADFGFDKIVLCGGDATDVYFAMLITPETDLSDVGKLVVGFDDKLISEYDVNKEDILAYWQNN